MWHRTPRARWSSTSHFSPVRGSSWAASEPRCRCWVLTDLIRRAGDLALGGWVLSLIALLAGALMIATAVVALRITVTPDFAAGTIIEHQTGNLGVQRVRTKPLAGSSGAHVARRSSSDAGDDHWDVFLRPSAYDDKPLLLRWFRLAEEAEARTFASEVAGRAGLPVIVVWAGMPVIEV